MAYFETFATQLGLSVWLIGVLVIWEAIWTALAMWRSAKKNHLIWFIVFFVLNLLAIPEIIYLIVTRDKKKRKKK